jgi:phosphopentomutase
MSRAFILLLDSFGLGATPDASKYGDQACNTFGHIAKWAANEGKPMSLPTMEGLGLAAAAHTASGEWAAGFAKRDGFTGAYGAAREQSTGKDTQSGHWEIAGVPVLFDWGYFPKEVPSFPKELTDKLQELTGVPGFLGNCHASGTTIINELGDEHVATGKPILYTSADSVLQIACHEEHFGLERLYDMCEKAYELVKPYNIGRIIARPFVGANGDYKRTANRHDYAVPPSAPTLLDHVKNEGPGQYGAVRQAAGGRGGGGRQVADLRQLRRLRHALRPSP